MADKDIIQSFKEKLATASPDLKAEYEAIKSQLSPLPEEEQVKKLVEDPQLRERYNVIIEKLIGKAELSDEELSSVTGGKRGGFIPYILTVDGRILLIPEIVPTGKGERAVWFKEKVQSSLKFSWMEYYGLYYELTDKKSDGDTEKPFSIILPWSILDGEI